MPECSYCKVMYDVPRGLTYVLDNGEVLYFCSSKCFKNWKLGRKPEKRNWIRKQKKSGKVEEKEVKKESAKKEQKSE